MSVTRAEDLPGLRELWSRTTGVAELTVAVLDGPVDVCHASLRGAKLQVVDPLGRAREDDAFIRSHGTAVASLLFGSHQGPLKGVAPGCHGLLIPIYQVVNRKMSCTQAELALAIREAVRWGADVINVSGGELTPGGAASRELIEAVHLCADKGRLLIAAAGNDGCINCLHVPGAIPSVLAVGATEPDGSPLAASNWGDAYRSQGIVAPGRNVLVAAPGGGYALASGTSLATPLVAGVAALLASLQRRSSRRSDLTTVRRILLAASIGCDEQTTDDCARLLFGRLNIARAHSYLTRNLKGTSMNDNPDSLAAPAGVAAAAIRSATFESSRPLQSPVATAMTEAASAVRDSVERAPLESYAAPLCGAAGAIAMPAASVTPSILPSDCGCGGNGNGAALCIRDRRPDRIRLRQPRSAGLVAGQY